MAAALSVRSSHFGVKKQPPDASREPSLVVERGWFNLVTLSTAVGKLFSPNFRFSEFRRRLVLSR